MSEVDVSLLIGLVIAAAFSFRNPRGLLWLAAGAASYVVSVIYWRSGSPNPVVMAAACDASVAFAIYLYGRFKWELRTLLLFLLSCGINTAYLGTMIGIIPSFSYLSYNIALELVNWLVLISIGGMSLLQWIGVPYGHAHRVWRPVRGLLGIVAALSRERARRPFHLFRAFQAGR